MGQSSDYPEWSDGPEWAKGMTLPPPWQRGAECVKMDTPWLRVSQFEAIAPTGHDAAYGLVHFKNRALAILPVFHDGTIAMVGQHRFPFGRFEWEIPEGGVPYSEDLLEGAKRELAEEAGLEARVWTPLLIVQTSNSVTDEVGYCYLATDLHPVPQAFDETEVLLSARVPFHQLLDDIGRGHIRDALTLVCLLRLDHLARTGQLDPALTEALIGR